MAPARNVICCFTSYVHKEEVMRQARDHEILTFNGADIGIFQGLLQITLRDRRALQPLPEHFKMEKSSIGGNFRLGLRRLIRDALHSCVRQRTYIRSVKLFNYHMSLIPEWYQKFLLPESCRTPPETKGSAQTQSPFLHSLYW